MLTELLLKPVLTDAESDLLRDWLRTLEDDCIEFGTRPGDPARLARIRNKIAEHDRASQKEGCGQ